MIYVGSTFRELTAPGYFDFSSGQTAKTKAMVQWFDLFTTRIESQVNLFDETFRLWATRDYSAVTVSMTPWILYLMKRNGIGWFGGSLADAIAILTYVSKSYPDNTILCFQEYFDFLLNTLSWTSDFGTFIFTPNIPAQTAETFLIYSTSGPAPSTPSAMEYDPLVWSAPSGWSKTAASATYYSRGYLSGGNIVWMTPQSTINGSMTSDAENIASLPASPSVADLCIVYDDGTGDIGSVYYYDGAVWRKTTSPNANQGKVVGGLPPIPGSAVWSTGDPFTSSGDPVPTSGPTQGYGYYGIYGVFITNSNIIYVVLNLTTEGENNLGMIIFLLRRIKPTLNTLILKYTTPTVSDYTEVYISDSGAT